MRPFHEQLDDLLHRVVLMGTLAESMVADSMAALVTGNAASFASVRAKENQVNALHMEIDDRAVKLAALQQPVARDVRFVFVASKIGSELERIGDHAVNVCNNAQHFREASRDLPMVDLSVMAEAAQKMVRNSLTALTHRDVKLAEEVMETEHEVDAFRDRIFRVLLQDMRTDSNTVSRAMSMIFIARNLERVGDHATNIAEEVIYWVDGRDVRHGGAAGRQEKSA